jgi:hypothetical protein
MVSKMSPSSGRTDARTEGRQTLVANPILQDILNALERHAKPE